MQGDVADGIAGRCEFIPHQADDGKFMAVGAQRDLLAERETGGTVDDHFVMAAYDIAPGQELARTAGPVMLEADEEEAERLAVQLGLDRLVGDRARAFHAVDPGDQLPCVARDSR